MSEPRRDEPDPGPAPEGSADPEITVEVVPALSGVPAAEWDTLAGADDPFVEHAFLAALETSGSVGPGTGWSPAHVIARRRGRLEGAVPFYVKTDSYGEYIFDWGWASASQRAGISYYPKLVSSIPFTPATGRRLLVLDGLEADAGRQVAGALVLGMRTIADRIDASSIHVLFSSAEERAFLCDPALRFEPRLTYQYHWTNEGYGSFDDYLAAFRSSSRKEVRRERRKAAASGLALRTVRGTELTDAEWAALYAFYRDTTGRKGAIPYLTPRFFEEIRRTLPERVVVGLASRPDGSPVAAALAFQKGRNLFGRYWGCLEDHEALHFELCYYRLIEFAIEHGLARFEAGAQGEHKIRRGLLPSPTFSAHWLRHPGLAEAVADHLPREAEMHEREMELLARHTPFKRPHLDLPRCDPWSDPWR